METQQMDPQTLNTYTNLFLLVAVVGGVAFAVYRATRKKPVEAQEIPKRPESFRPKTRKDEEVYEEPPITDFREMPERGSMHDAIVKPPSFKPVPKPPVKASKAPKSYLVTPKGDGPVIRRDGSISDD